MTVATLGGVHLSLRAGESISWTLAAGVAPVERQITVTEERARAIFTRAKTQFATLDPLVTRTRSSGVGPLTLEVAAPGYPKLTVRGLYVLQMARADESRMTLTIADRRWLLHRAHVLRDFNVRRTTGDRRLVGNALQPVQISANVADYAYRRSSLREGTTRWEPEEVLEDVLDQLVGTGGYVIESLPLRADVEDLRLDDAGDAALMRVLALFAGAQIFCDLRGRLVVYNSLGGEEDAVIASAGAPYPSPAPQLERVDNSLLRARDYVSLFTLEPEIRFDYTEGVSVTPAAPGREPRALQNVFAVTDPTVTVLGQTLSRGTLLPLDRWIAAVVEKNDAPASGRALGPLTSALIRRHYLSGFQHLRNAYVLAELGLPNPLWLGRIAEIERSWRRSFRVLPQWADKCEGFYAVRAAVVDQETGERAQSEVYCDTLVKPSRRFLSRRAADNSPAAFGASQWAQDLTAATPAPARVVMRSRSEGRFALDFRADPWGDAAKIAPGTLDGVVPIQHAGEAALVWDSVKVSLAAGWRLSVILSVRLASPADQTRLHAVSVPLSRALALIPGASARGLSGRGPTYTQRVYPGVTTARAVWLDDRAGEIEDAIFSDAAFPQDLIVNGAVLLAIAEANAARIVAPLLDRQQGSMVVSLAPAVRPAGSLASVTHVITTRGAQTILTCPPVGMPPNIRALLPDSVRKVLDRRVEE